MQNHTTMKTILASRVKEEVNDWLSTGKRLIPILFLLLFGVGNVWGYNNVYLSGEMNSWGTYDYGTSGNGTYYIYTQKNQTFKFKVSSYWRGAYGSSTYSITIGNNYTVCDCDGQNFKYTGNTGIVAFSFSQTTSGGSEWKPNISLARPTIYIRHNWNNTGWSNQSMTDNNDGTYKYDGIYSGSKATNVGPCSDCTSGSATFKYITSATLVGSPETGDKCRFVYNSNGYKGEGSESSNTGTLTITKLCKITYNGNGKTSGTVPSAQSDKLYNTSVTLSSNNLTKTGYTHTGWNTEADGRGTHYDKGESITVTETNLTLYAEWTPTTTTITLSKNAQGGSTVTGAASVTATYDAALPSFTALSSTNDYALTGYWTSASAGTKIINANGTLVPNVTISTTPYTGADGIWKYTGSTLTLHAQWSLDRTLTYDGNGATSGSVPAAATSYSNGTSVTVLGNTGSFVKTGYTFTGWNTAADGNGTAKVAGNSITMDANYTLFAQWSENKSSVSIAASPSGAGTFSPASPVLAGVDTKPNVTATAVPGYKFSSWAITGGATISSTSTNPTTVTGKGASEAATLTANFVRTYAFIEGRFHVTNASRNGTWTNTFGDGNWDDSSTRIPFAYDETNHQFYLRTYATPKELSTQISSLPPYFFIKTSTASGSLTNVKTYRPYTSGTDYQELTTAGDSYKKNIGENTNDHSFWFNSTDESGYVKLYFNESKIWYWLEQTLEYNANGGTGTAPASKTYYDKGTSVQAKANTYTRTGYTFTGWNTKATGSGTAVAANGWHTLDANTTFYAQWSEDNYTVTVQAGEHGSIASGSVTGHKDTKVTLPTATADPGYYFTGWTRVSGSTVTWTNQSSATAAQVNGLTSGVTVRANFAPLWSLAGGPDGEADWPLDAAHKFTSYSTNASSHQEGHLSFDLAANSSYWIKLYNNQSSAYYGLASGSSPRDVYYSTPSTGWDITGATGNISLYVHTAAAGTYDFYWDIEANKLYVHYPTSWFITSGQKTEGQDDNAGGSFTAEDDSSNDVKGGKFVANNASVTFTATPNTGYNFSGWWSDAACTSSQYTAGTDVEIDGNAMTLSSIAADKTVYAKFTAKTYTVTLTRSGTGYGSGGTASVTATYNQTLPAATMPTAAQGYAFMGYYTAADGEGSQLVAANGTWQNVAGYTSGGKWIRDGGAELFAYFKKGAISALTLDAAIVAQGNTVGITPTLDPVPVGDKVICWRVLHGNGNPLDDQPAFSWDGTKVTFPASANSGTYLAEAILRKGTTCGGEVLDSVTVSFQVAGDHTVTVQYKCGDEFIQTSTTATGRPLSWTEITAPTIFGYTFSKWKAGDGITIDGADGSGENASATIKFKATYEGKLTAIYTQNNIIYFKNTLGWNSVRVHFLDGDYWTANKGSGNKGKSNCNLAMTHIDDTDIWYYDYGAASITPSRYIVFTKESMSGYENFYQNSPNVAHVVFPTRYADALTTDKSTEAGFYSKTPMFVPLAGQTGVKQNDNRAEYYNAGYWTKYTPGTGYSLKIYNSAGNTVLKTIDFTSEGDLMPMTAVVDLEASTSYKYELVREGDVYYGNDNDMTYSNHGQSVPWEMSWKEGGHKVGFTTNAAGNYTFHLTYSAYSSQYRLRMSYDYPIAGGDYRVIYKDGVQTRYKASAIITKVNNGKDTVSFFIRPGNASKVMKIQQATVNEFTGAVTWSAETDITSCLSGLTKDSVYNICLQMNGSGAISVENVEIYTGDFYIRTDCANSKWDNYRSDPDHRMTYSEYSITHGGYSHYYCHWVQTDDRKNIKFCIANDYSPSISDTLTRETASGEWANIGSFIDEHGNILRNANVRFMWNQHDNTIKRAYIDGAQGSGSDNFLKMLSSDSKIKDLSGTPKTEVYFQDNENWIYETNIQAQPNAQYKLVSNWGTSPVITQYFKGSSTTTETLITGSGDIWYVIRVIYDFKTNRILAAWMPEGELEEAKEINADVMFIREHQGDINQLILNEEGEISKINTAYGVMRFNKWTINNKEKTGEHNPLASPASIYERSLYWVSFPFRVKLSEVFGFGTYGTHWILQYYDGAERAEKGMWAETGSYWKFIWDRKDFILEPNTGYLLALETELMRPESSVWGPGSKADQVELFFPSYGTMPDITQDNVVIPLEEHTCTINRSGGNLPGGNDYRTTYDRRIVDSHWNVMGVPTYVNTDDVTFPASEWTTNLPKFLYTWNADDNTITAASASGFTFHAMHAYMVQYYGNVTWSAHSGSPYSPIVARSTYSEKPKEVEFCIELTQNETMLDRTFINLSDDETVSAGFAFNEDMTKEFSGNKPAIYTFIDTDVVAAGNTLPMSDQKTIVPLGVETKQAGDYTIAIPNGTNGVGVTLIDEETGVHTSLSALDYTVSLPAGKHDNRFFLEISPIKTTPTGIEDVQGGNVQSTKVHKVMIDGILYIVKDGKIFDARGARLR